MGIQFRFNWTQVEQSTKRMKTNIPKSIGNEIEKALIKGAHRVEADAVNNAPSNTGNLRNSIGVRWEGEGMKMIAEVYAKTNYAVYVEMGTKPHSAPFDAIKEYAKDIGKPDEWFSIWLGIKHHGTKAHPFMKTAFYKNRNWISNEVKKAIKKGIKG